MTAAGQVSLETGDSRIQVRRTGSLGCMGSWTQVLAEGSVPLSHSQAASCESGSLSRVSQRERELCKSPPSHFSAHLPREPLLFRDSLDLAKLLIDIF